MKIKTISAAVLFIAFGSCTKDIGGPEVCFQEKVLPIFISNCTYSGCHDGKTGRGRELSLTTYEGIMQEVTAKHPLQSEVYKSIRGSNPSMPPEPYNKLSSADVATIKLWIDMGAKNTSNCSSCDTSNYTYEGRIAGIMQTWCTGCHNSTNAGGGYDLTSYEQVVKACDNNRLPGSVQHLSGYIAMPQSGNKISDCEITAIVSWVSHKFPRN